MYSHEEEVKRFFKYRVMSRRLLFSVTPAACVLFLDFRGACERESSAKKGGQNGIRFISFRDTGGRHRKRATRAKSLANALCVAWMCFSLSDKKQMADPLPGCWSMGSGVLVVVVSATRNAADLPPHPGVARGTTLPYIITRVSHRQGVL